MPGSLTTIVKGTVCGKTDEKLQAATKELLTKWLGDFEDSSQSLKDIAKKYGVMATAQDKHFDHFFSNGAGAFFPEIRDEVKSDVVRGAFIQGLRLSLYSSPGVPRSAPKPVIMYWIAGGPAFEAYVSDSVEEVHIILMTPDPTPELVPPTNPADTRDEPIWIVATPNRTEAIRKRGLHYTYKTPESMPSGIGIECQQIKSY